MQGLYPLWEQELQGPPPLITGLSTTRPEVLLTTVLDAAPDARNEQPGPTIWPLYAALAVGVTFIVAIFTPWGFVIGPLLLAVALIGWGWPRDPGETEEGPEEAEGSHD